MKRSLLIVISIVFVLFQANAQNLDLSLGFGSYRVPNKVKYELPREGFNLNIGLIYQLNDKWAMGTVINHSAFRYDRPSLVDTPVMGFSFITEGSVKIDHLYFTIIRKISFPKSIEAGFGLGLGAFIETNGYYVPLYFDEEKNAYRGFSGARETNLGIHIPLTYSVRKIFVNKVHLGLEGGFFFDQNLNTRGIFIGPKAGIFL